MHEWLRTPWGTVVVWLVFMLPLAVLTWRSWRRDRQAARRYAVQQQVGHLG